jgi:hypothetical protein
LALHLKLEQLYNIVIAQTCTQCQIHVAWGPGAQASMVFEYKSNKKVLRTEMKDKFRSTRFVIKDVKLRPGPWSNSTTEVTLT